MTGKWKENEETGKLTRIYCHNSLHIYHNSGKVCLQSHSDQAHRIRSSVSVGCFNFAVFLFNPMTDLHFFGELLTAFKFKTGFMGVVHTSNAVSVTFGISNSTALTHRA